MRKFSAQFIISGMGDVLEKGIIVVNDEGTITDIIDTRGVLTEIASLEFYNGVLVPGFVNAHCHLELSHLKGLFPEKTRLAGFLKRVDQHCRIEEEIVVEAARKADIEMWNNGISAVGDISNVKLSFPVKASSKIYYHTFIESLGFSPERAEKAFNWTISCLEEARALGLSASIVPHSPYSVSKDLFSKISEHAEKENAILSMHSQESAAEDDLYQSGTGQIVTHLTENLLIDISSFIPSGKSALSTVLVWLPSQNNLLLIHNLCTTQEDIEMIRKVRLLDKTFFVLCPNSNLYIEDRLPDITLFRNNHLRLCLGTDSLSSNKQLSILEEMKTIQNHFPTIPLKEIVSWATRNGAEALGITEWAGTIEVGKKPGINLISGMDLQNLRLLPQSKVRRLI
jgi:cytosine/adenosine deaminase-related metal-dependent hydrolase